MMRFLYLVIVGVFATCFSYGSAVLPAQSEEAERAPKILVLGDSMMVWNRAVGQSVGDHLSYALNEPVSSRALAAARVRYGFPVTGAMGMAIPKQFHATDEQAGLDWVVMNGGGNDLWFGCGCNRCDRRLNAMISEDGKTGDIPDLVSRIRDSGARVLYLGYLRSPGVGSLVDECREEGDALEARLAAMAKHDRGVRFVSNADVVPDGDKSFHALDRIHPSAKGSKAIAARAAAALKSLDASR